MQELTTFIANHQLLSILTVIALLLAMILELIRVKQRSFSIPPVQATLMINHQDAVVVDIRPVETFRSGHIIDAKSIPSAELLENSKKIEKFKNRPIIIVCPAGVESQKIAATLIKQGYNAFSLTGGMRAWNEAQMPLVKG